MKGAPKGAGLKALESTETPTWDLEAAPGSPSCPAWCLVRLLSSPITSALSLSSPSPFVCLTSSWLQGEDGEADHPDLENKNTLVGFINL